MPYEHSFILRYRGYYYDSETELYYLQSRYYDPTTCRFINADAYASTGQGILGHNMFAYCLNNAVSRKDPYGTSGVAVANVDDYDPIKDWLSSLSGVSSGTGAGGVIVISVDAIGTMGLKEFLELLVGPIEFNSGISSLTEAVKKAEKAKEEKDKKGKGKKPTPPKPDVTFPGYDPTKPPDGYEWKGPDPAGGKRGGYKNQKPNFRDSWHPDLDHGGDIEPHWDYNDIFGRKWRVFPNKIELAP